MAFKLYQDLDGCLADFDAKVYELTGMMPSDQPIKDMWRILARADDFYNTLDWMPDGRILWNYVSTHSPTILTGLPYGKWAAPQKREWCSRELGPMVPVITCMAADKASVAELQTPDGVIPVLVDDRLKAQHAWEQMGGIFVHHTSAQATILQLRALFGD